MKHLALFLMLMAGFALQAQTDIYQRYADRDDLERVACLTNRRLDDGTRVDITLLRARDSVAMRAVMDELKLPQVKERRVGSVVLSLRDNTNPANPAPRRRDGKVNLRRSCLVGYSLSENTVFVYHNVRTERRYQSILAHVLARAQKQRN